jgi:hypothetical protein
MHRQGAQRLLSGGGSWDAPWEDQVAVFFYFILFSDRHVLGVDRHDRVLMIANCCGENKLQVALSLRRPGFLN